MEHWWPLFAGIWEFMGFSWSAVDLKKKHNRVTVPGFWGGLGFSFPWGSGWVALLSCGHGDWGFVHSWL